VARRRKGLKALSYLRMNKAPKVFTGDISFHFSMHDCKASERVEHLVAIAIEARQSVTSPLNK